MNDFKKSYNVLVSLGLCGSKCLAGVTALREKLSKSCSVFQNFRFSVVAIGSISTF